MEIEVHQRGGVLGMDRLYVVKNGRIEIIDRGESRGSLTLDPDQAARIDALAADAAGVRPTPGALGFVDDDMNTAIAITVDEGHTSHLNLSAGDEAPDVVWDLISEVSSASEG